MKFTKFIPSFLKPASQEELAKQEIEEVERRVQTLADRAAGHRRLAEIYEQGHRLVQGKLEMTVPLRKVESSTPTKPVRVTRAK